MVVKPKPSCQHCGATLTRSWTRCPRCGKRSWTWLLAGVQEDVTNHQPDREPDTGLDKFRQAVNGVMGAVPDSEWTTLNLIEEGDLVVCHNRWSGTYGGTVFRGIPTPGGKRFSTEHVHIYRVTDGRIAEHWVVRDDLGMMLQVGAITAGT